MPHNKPPQPSTPLDDEVDTVLIDLVVKTQKLSKFNWELPKDIEVSFPELTKAKAKLDQVYAKQFLELLPEKKDIAGNFDITEDGGIDHADTDAGRSHALKFAEWTGYNLAVDDARMAFSKIGGL